MPHSSASRTIIFIIFVIALLIAVFLLVFNKKGAQMINQLPLPVSQVSPTAANVTSQNADKIMEETDNAIQQAIGQLDADLKSLDKIDKTQDSTIGL